MDAKILVAEQSSKFTFAGYEISLRHLDMLGDFHGQIK